MKKAIWIVLAMFVTCAVAATGEVDPGTVMPEDPAEATETSSMELLAPDVEMTPAAGPPECPNSWRRVTLNCRGDSRGLVTGQYGGTDFFLVCDGNRSTGEICVGGNGYRYIMEAETPGGSAVRCADSGSSVQVNEFCGPLHLIIN